MDGNALGMERRLRIKLFGEEMSTLPESVAAIMFKKPFIEGLLEVQDQSDEVITAYCGNYMRTIPVKLRVELAKDPFMAVCIYEDPAAPNHNCDGRLTYEHAYIYAGKQINEPWAIVPCCENHNSGQAMLKDYNQYRALIRADLEQIKNKYPRHDWETELRYLIGKYGQ